MPSNTKYIVNGAQLTDIGDAIRSKLGEQDTYTVDEMPGKINNIGGGGSFPMCTASIVNTDAESIATKFNFDNGFMTLTPFPQNTTTECHFLYTKYPGNIAIITIDAPNLIDEYLSDMVNCSLVTEDRVILVTDPTQDCSFTINAYAWSLF